MSSFEEAQDKRGMKSGDVHAAGLPVGSTKVQNSSVRENSGIKWSFSWYNSPL